jgi:ketosteroid isomerase-like protein
VPEESATPDLLLTVRRFTDAFNRSDWNAALAMFTPDAVWELSSGGFGSLETRTLAGPGPMRRFFSELTEAFEHFETVNDYTELAKGVLFSVSVLRGRPFGGSAFVESRYGIVWTGKDGWIESVTDYNDVDEARAAAERLAHERG